MTTEQCGCDLLSVGKDGCFRYCPLHNAAPRLLEALTRAQRNHHVQAVARRQHPHRGAHWQHCPSPSCVEAHTAIAQAKGEVS